jgi:branched-chain amino acid transport system substrate-binding protein
MSDQPEPQASFGIPSQMDRRRFLQLAGVAGAAVSAPGLLAACQVQSSSSGGTTQTIKLGYVSPETGALAPFGEADAFVIGAIRKYFVQHGLTVAGKKYNVQIIVKDSQSTDQQASNVANDLILNERVHLMLVSSTPDTTNPVSDACEANQVPCISTVAPWQSWFVGRGGKPGQTTFKWTYHFFWGLEDLISVYTDMWSKVSTNKVVGALWPNDPDGNAFADHQLGFPPAIQPQGYSVVDPGRYQDLATDYSAQIARYKAGGAEILTGVPLPPDFTTFWKQARQQGYTPKIATVAKALLFPSSVTALGDIANNLGTEIWWTPSHPFSSSLTGQTAKQLAAAYTASAKKQWTQPIGFAHALFEVAKATLSGAKALDAPSIAASVASLKIDTVVGPLDWTGGPVKNVAKTPLVGGQWRKGTTYPFDLVIVSNKDHTNIPSGGSMQPMS